LSTPSEAAPPSERMEARTADTLKTLLSRYRKWLYLENDDTTFIEVAIAATLDRELPGDPVWLFLVAPSGAIKTETIRSLSGYPRSYSLDTLTPATLVSGLTKNDKDTGEPVPIAGILKHLDGKTLLIKDFTTILSSADDIRMSIYGQLRAAYDGYFEKAFGTLPHPIRIHATFGMVAGVTPAIDKYSKMTNVLGARFLMIRQSPDPLKAARAASRNTGQEAEMRAQLAGSCADYISRLDFSKVPQILGEQEEQLIRIGCYVALMRTPVFARYHQGSLYDMDLVEPEVPTRISKQLLKLGQLLAVLRRHDGVLEEDFKTLRRVAKDSAKPKRQRIIDAYAELGWTTYMNVSDITGRTRGMYYQTVQNEVEVMKVLGILGGDNAGNVRPTEKFREYLEVVYPEVSIPLPRVS